MPPRASSPDQEWTDAFIEATGINDPGAPVPCPRCGKPPRIQEERLDYHGNMRLRFICKRWLGLRLCAAGPWVYDEREWADTYAKNAATSYWNRWVKAKKDSVKR